MQSADIPSVFNIPWADSAVPPYIHAVPEASQIAITPGAASLTDGFVPVNFLSPLAGGVPPFGNDMNGILNQITAWLRWVQAGGPVRYSTPFQTAITGYPLGAIVQSATVTGKLWCSTAEGNVTDPDDGGAGWIPAMNTVYAPLTGEGASGLWGIDITGNADTATDADTATELTGTPSFFAPITNSLASDVSVVVNNTLYAGPTVAQGTTGKWFASGSVRISSQFANDFDVVLWDGTTIMSSGSVHIPAGEYRDVSVSGYIDTPAGNIRISAACYAPTGGTMLITALSQAARAKASTVTAFRIG